MFASPHELADAAGTELGPGPWLVVDQRRIDAFADATGDDQWIHVDPARAAAGPFRGTIAHGYLTLSLISVMIRDLIHIEGLGAHLNYGLNRVRFPAPLRAGSAVRARGRILSVDPVPGGYQLVTELVIEIEGGERPACVAETVSRAYPA